MLYKYGIKPNVTGVYMITNVHNRKRYIGASVNIASRMSNHMNRDARRYLNHPFYIDVREYGIDSFRFDVLKECEKDYLLHWEQYYYDILKPEYNLVRPAEHNFIYDNVVKKAIRNSQSDTVLERRRKLYNTDIYLKKFRTMHTDRMKSVEMFDIHGKFIKTFISIRECARWLNDNTDYKGINKASKVKAVCDGERNTAYGYKFKYSSKSVETIL